MDVEVGHLAVCQGAETTVEMAFATAVLAAVRTRMALGGAANDADLRQEHGLDSLAKRRSWAIESCFNAVTWGSETWQTPFPRGTIAGRAVYYTLILPPRVVSLYVLEMSEVTRILSAIEQGDARAAEQLLPLVYDELRKLATAKLAQERPGQTLQATALVHEAYVRLVEGKNGQAWDSRGHFFAAAAEAMRRILVDQARRKKSERRGGERLRLDVTEALPAPRAREESDRILAIHEALAVLEAEMPRKAELIKLRFFAGMTLEEAAAALGISVPTAKRDWAAARVWLYRRLSEA
jgi:RNA polymerase sigma factor (TIGR02999 family)